MKTMEARRNRGRALCAAVALVALSPLAGYADDPVSSKEASPSLKERIVQETVTGDVLRIDDDFVVVKETDGREVRLHVDKTTKMDKIMPGDQVKGYMDERGHATTIQRVD